MTQLKRGADLVEVMTADGMLDTETTPGLLSMFGIITGSVANFHCFMPWRTLWDAVVDEAQPSVPSPIEDAIFAASLRTSWGVLGLMAHDSQSWLIPASRHRPLLDAALEVWPALDAVGERYAVGSMPQRLWSVPNNLHFVLANLGVPNDMLGAPLPPEGPRALLRYVRPVN
ncbi:MAG TPA: hypothetical protein VF516_03790 [Kofleriaceae bacterium]